MPEANVETTKAPSSFAQGFLFRRGYGGQDGGREGGKGERGDLFNRLNSSR